MAAARGREPAQVDQRQRGEPHRGSTSLRQRRRPRAIASGDQLRQKRLARSHEPGPLQKRRWRRGKTAAASSVAAAMADETTGRANGMAERSVMSAIRPPAQAASCDGGTQGPDCADPTPSIPLAAETTGGSEGGGPEARTAA